MTIWVATASSFHRFIHRQIARDERHRAPCRQASEQSPARYCWARTPGVLLAVTSRAPTSRATTTPKLVRPAAGAPMCSGPLAARPVGLKPAQLVVQEIPTPRIAFGV